MGRVTLLNRPLVAGVPGVDIAVPLDAADRSVIHPAQLIDPVAVIVVPSTVGEVPGLEIDGETTLEVLGEVGGPTVMWGVPMVDIDRGPQAN